MPEITIPFAVGLHRYDESIVPNDYTIGTTTFGYITETDRRDAGPTLKNMIIGTDGDGPYVTQRPPVKDAQNNGSLTGSNRGRGIFKDQEDRVVVVRGTNVSTTKVNDGGFLTEASTTISATLTSSDGYDKVYITQSDTDELAILDIENDKIWQFDMTGSGTATEVADVDVPTDLCRGLVWLNNKLYFGTRDNARIYNTASGDITDVTATDFLTVERQKAQLQMIELHHDHIVAFTDRSIEFFFDNANPNGSPLRRRQDLYYNVGCVTEVTRVGDIIYFIGRSHGGDYGIYKIEDFQLQKISEQGVNYKIEAMVKGATRMHINGLVIEGRTMLCILQVNGPAANPALKGNGSLWYDTLYKTAYEWDSTLGDKVAAISTTTSNIFQSFSGNTFYFKGLLSENAVDDSDDDQADSTEASFDWSVRTPSITLGTSKRKFWKSVVVDGFHQQNLGDTDMNMQLAWTDDFYEDLPTGTDASKVRIVNFKDFRFIEKGLGSSRQRAFEITPQLSGSNNSVKFYLRSMTIEFEIGN